MSPGVTSQGPARRGPGRRRGRWQVVSAGASDHAAIYHFLTGVFQGPSRAEFKAALEDPFYEPADRILVKHGGRIVAHAHVTHRVMQFGPLQIPTARLAWLGTLPQYRSRGHAGRLLREAEKQMAGGGALIGQLCTTVPHFFRRTGWAPCGRHSFSRADVRAVLARLLAGRRRRDRRRREHGALGRRRKLQIRPFRRWEEPALKRIYDQDLDGAYGPLQRTAAYWHWLIRRQAYDQIYVALDGPDPAELDESRTPIVGFAVAEGEAIAELFCAPGRRAALAELLERVCRDSIEHDRHSIVLHASPPSRLHRLLGNAGGSRCYHESDGGQVRMTRLLAPLKLLRLMCGEFSRRADEAGLVRPLELGLLVEGKKYRLEITPRHARAVSRRIGRSYLQLNMSDFTRLLLGQLHWDRALAEGRLTASTALAREAGRVLFPRLPLWCPPFDDLPA